MKPIEKISVTEATVASIKELIVSGDYNIGDKLPSEMELGKDLNVSRNTIRESIKVLQALGFIELKPGRGAFVLKTSENENEILNWFTENEDQISDFIGIRISVETTSIKLAIKKSSSVEINRLVKELNYIQEKFENASEVNDAVKMNYYDKSFHSEITKAAKDKLLIAMNELIANAFTGYRLKIFSVKGNNNSSIGVHRKIIEAINNKNTDDGIKAIVNNLDNYLYDIKAK